MTDDHKHNDEQYDGNPYDDFSAEELADYLDPPKDALRVIRWSLQRSCPYREGDGWELPDTTHEQLAELVELAKQLLLEFERVYVSSTTRIYYSPVDYLLIPDRGFRVDDAFGPYGGVRVVIANCGNCPVNVDPIESPYKRFAACHGELKVVSDHPLFAPAVQQAIANHGLEDEVATRFPNTNPPWYGFWMRSPLLRPQAEVLLPVLDEALAKYEYGIVEGAEEFLEALSIVHAWGNVAMHVTLRPPESHDKIGFWGFHCPVCKAPSPDAELRPQKPGLIRQLPTIDCPVCGSRYAPQKTRGQYQPPPPEVQYELLEEQLGSEAYWQFVYKYLVHMQQPPERAEQYCRWERQRREENPKSWEQRMKDYPTGPDDVPYHGPPCSDCREYLPSPEAKRCECCGFERQ